MARISSIEGFFLSMAHEIEGSKPCNADRQANSGGQLRRRREAHPTFVCGAHAAELATRDGTGGAIGNSTNFYRKRSACQSHARRAWWASCDQTASIASGCQMLRQKTAGRQLDD